MLVQRCPDVAVLLLLAILTLAAEVSESREATRSSDVPGLQLGHPTASPVRRLAPKLQYASCPQNECSKCANIAKRLRQDQGQDPNPSTPPASLHVPHVTVYSMLKQVGDSALLETYTFTQTFAKAPDQFRAPRPGRIGLGDHEQRTQIEALEGTRTVNTGIDGRVVMR